MRAVSDETLQRIGRKYSSYGVVSDFDPTGSVEESSIPLNVAKTIALERDDYKCRICGMSPLVSEKDGSYDKLRVEVEVHHIIPKIAGGTNSTKNLVTLCKACHVKTFKNDYSGLPSIPRKLGKNIEIITNSRLLIRNGNRCTDRKIEFFYYKGKELHLDVPLTCKACHYVSLSRVRDLIFHYGLDIEEIVIKNKKKEFCVGILEK